jgi:D-sedoheptulose 7-phosphate isomerase
MYAEGSYEGERTGLPVSKETLQEYIQNSLNEGAKARAQLAEACSESLEGAARKICESLKAGGKVLIFGNGGSAADAQHVAAELVGRFRRERAGLAAIALTTDSSIFTSVANDYGFAEIFARQLTALGRAGDVAIAISTSGNSANVVEGLKAAQAAGLVKIVLSGGTGGCGDDRAVENRVADTGEPHGDDPCDVRSGGGDVSGGSAGMMRMH